MNMKLLVVFWTISRANANSTYIVQLDSSSNSSVKKWNLVAARSRSTCTKSQCTGAVSTGVGVCTTALSIFGSALGPWSNFFVNAGCNLFSNKDVNSAACSKICGPDAPEPLPDYSEVLDAMDKNTLRQQEWFDSLTEQNKQILINQQELLKNQKTLLEQVTKNAQLIVQGYSDLSDQLKDIEKKLDVMSYFAHYNEHAIQPVEECWGIFVEYTSSKRERIRSLHKQQLLDCAWKLGSGNSGAIQQLAIMLTTGASHSVTHDGSIWAIGTASDDKAFCRETFRQHYMEYLPMATFLRSLALQFIEDGMRPKVSVGLRGAAMVALADSFDTPSGIKKWLETKNEEVFSHFDAFCKPRGWLIEFSFPLPSWKSYGWNLNELKVLDSAGRAMAISPGSSDGWSPAPHSYGPEKALDGNMSTWYRLPSIRDGYKEMDKMSWPIGGVIESEHGWTLEQCMVWCNNEPENKCLGFSYDRDAKLGPNGQIMTTIDFQGYDKATEQSDFTKSFVKQHGYRGPKVARFVAKESWQNGSLVVPKYVEVSSYSPQPRDGPIFMQVRYQERDGKTLAPTPLLAQAHLANKTSRFDTGCYGGNSSREWGSRVESSPSSSCQSQQCFVKDYSSRSNSILGADSIVSSAGDCQVACQNHHSCAYWTWYGSAARETKNSCVLKTMAADIFDLQVGAMSGPRSCPKR